MVWVNLLPWRSRQLKVRLYQEFFLIILLMAAPFAVLLPVMGQQVVNEQRLKVVQRWKEANKQAAAIKARAAALSQQQQSLQLKQAVRRHQQRQLTGWYDFTRDLAEHLPKTLWLSGLSKTPDSLTLTGGSQKIGDLHDFRQWLRSRALFQQIKIERIGRDELGRIRFRLLATLRNGDLAGE